ncbi:hypothetical protein NUM3379_43020 [Kineococcus sp. NUM-3379]
MARPTDWWVLALPGDPVPGEPWQVRRLSTSARGTGENAATAEREVRSLAGDQAVLTWVGAAADAFRPAIGDLPDKLGKVAASYEKAADALRYWADTLEMTQGEADRALARGREARETIAALSGQLSTAQMADAAASGNARILAGPPAPGVCPPDPAQVQAAVRNAQHAAARVSSLNDRIGQVQDELSLARRLALQAQEIREDAANRTATQLQEASEAGIKPDSFWHDLKEVGKKVWRVTVTVAKVVAVVVGVVALFIGGPVVWGILAVAGAALLVDSIIRWRKGEGSIWDVGLEMLAFVPGGRVLGSAGRIFKSLGRGVRAVGLWAGKAARAVGGKLRQAATALRDRVNEAVKFVRRRFRRADRDATPSAERSAPTVQQLPPTTAASVNEKLDRYLLNPDHPLGKEKAAWFRQALGFTRENVEALAVQVRFDASNAVPTELTAHGQKYTQVIAIHGANGRVIDVTFAWIRNNDDVVRLITAIPAKK